jgi:hypothetical protein
MTIADAWHLMFAPANRSPRSEAGGEHSPRDDGRAGRAVYEQAAFKLDEFRRAVDPLPDADKSPSSTLSRADAQPNPGVPGAARTRCGETWTTARPCALGTGKLEQFIENYFPAHLGGSGARGHSVSSRLRARDGSKRPLEGGEVVPERAHDSDDAEGIAARARAGVDEPGRSDAAQAPRDAAVRDGASVAGRDEGRGAREVRALGEGAPDGYQRINDKIATVFGP